MCGRYRRKSDKQRIAEIFQVSVGLEELYLAPDDDAAPGSIQPVVLANDSDPAGGSLTVASVTNGAHGQVAISGGGQSNIAQN